jgi:hypothetical protein
VNESTDSLVHGVLLRLRSSLPSLLKQFSLAGSTHQICLFWQYSISFLQQLQVFCYSWLL